LLERGTDMAHMKRTLSIEIGNMTILFWTEKIVRKGFRINGFVNHYTDFIIQTKVKMKL
jgi:type III restriction enzyme